GNRRILWELPSNRKRSISIGDTNKYRSILVPHFVVDDGCDYRGKEQANRKIEKERQLNGSLTQNNISYRLYEEEDY
ncbi:hypothetical protein R0K18_36210, partial [Pantoea sp. SIMBA_133]